jgi:NADH-quinone oxidoreductase subunit G
MSSAHFSFTETAGTFVNCEGRAQSFYPVVKSLGDSRPGWKVIRVLGEMLGLAGFALDSIEEVRRASFGGQSSVDESKLNNTVSARAPSFLPL